MGNNRYKGISRIDNDVKNMHGWFARVYYKSKVFDNKYFNDKKYDGKGKALAAAIEYRNETIQRRNKKYPGAKNSRRRILSDSRNKTGIIGVSRSSITSKTGNVSEFFQVTWRPRKNTVKVKTFSIKKYGEVGALHKAWNIRKQAEKKMYGKTQTPKFEIYKRNYLDRKRAADLPNFENIF